MWATPRLATLPIEEAWVLAVDNACNLRAARCIARGGHASVGLRAADPVRAAIRLDATAFFLVHNHPSGDPTPSRDDELVTARIAAVAAIVDIPLLEHVVIARSGHAVVSFCRDAA
jgi:DNA repair protein RadC